MASEVAVRAPGSEGVFLRRMKERVQVWRRLFLQNWNLFKASRIGVIGLAIMIAFVILALAAPFMGLRDPIRWTAPDEDLIEFTEVWRKDSSQVGSEFEVSRLPPVSQPLAFRVLPDSSDARSDRLYLAAGDRLYAIRAQPSLKGQNAWAIFNYFNVSERGVPAPRQISAPPIVLNLGNYVEQVPDYEVYVPTDDGTLFILQDAGDTVPLGRWIQLEPGARITGIAAFNGDMDATFKLTLSSEVVPAIWGAAHHVFWNESAGAWTDEALPSNGDDGEYASLAFDTAGNPLIAYYSVWAGVPRVQVRDPAAGWRPFHTSPPEPFSDYANVGLYVSLQVGSDDRPRLAYYDESDGNLKYAEWNGTGYGTPTFVDTYGDVGQYASLALAGDLPRIAYYNATGRSLMFAAYDGTRWTTEVVDPGPGVGRFASLAIDGSGDAHIAYYDEGARALRYVRQSAGVWTAPEVVDQGNDVGRYASLALDGFVPHIAYFDATDTALKHAWISAGWRTEVVDDTSDVGRYASLGISASGPAVAYYDARDLNLKYASWTPSGWRVETVLSRGFAGQYNSLRFDADGRPHIATYVFQAGRTDRDLVVVGTETGRLYAVDVGVPAAIEPIGTPPREKRVTRWDYRVRWSADLGSEVHLASGPMNSPGAVPLFSPAFTKDGSIVVSGTADGYLVANYTANGTAAWPPIRIGAQWSSPPIVETASEGPADVRDQEIVYAASNRQEEDNPETLEDETGWSFLHAVLARTGRPISEWATAFAGFGGAAPVGPTAGTPDGGDLGQPTVEGSVIFVGSSSGTLYAIRRDGTGTPGDPSYLAPALPKWDPNQDGVPDVFRDPSLTGLNPDFRFPPIVVTQVGILLAVANYDAGTPSDPLDDRGVLYSIKMDVGNLSWKKTFPAPISGHPISWKPYPTIAENVWVGYGGPLVSGAAAYLTAGSFLAPSPPSWAHEYKCGENPDGSAIMCPGYPSGNQYWLGLDSQGRDIFSQVIWGSRIALLVGFLSAFFTVVLGVVVGLIAGYVGGKVEAVLMRFTDVILVLPGLPLIITLAAVLGASIWNIILVISLLGWPGIARIIRAEVLSLKERPFIDSARVTGASTTRIVFKHIAPNVMPLAFLYMTFSVSGAILTEAALSFIGLGDPTTMSWGIMLQLVSQSKSLQAWWWLLPPGLAITLISLAFFLVGRAFDEIVNPRLRKR